MKQIAIVVRMDDIFSIDEASDILDKAKGDIEHAIMRVAGGPGFFAEKDNFGKPLSLNDVIYIDAEYDD